MAEKNPLESRAVLRLQDARRWKELWMLDFKECYFFAAPHRQRQISSQVRPPTQRLLDAPELQTSLAFELCQDFVTEVTNTFMPEAQRWCERAPGMFIPKQAWDSVKDQVREDDGRIFDAMKASNLYPELSKAFYPDLAIGTIGLWIERRHAHQPITVHAVPLREIECNLGPDGEIDDRFAVRYTRNTDVEELVGPEVWAKMKEKMPELVKGLDDKPSERVRVVWGFWRIWDKSGEETWQHVVMVEEKLVHDSELKGEGSCPLLIGRFNPSADWPWGLGPMIQGLPDFRQIDELEARKIEGVSRAINPPLTYPDDSFSEIELGIEDGMAYPIRAGSEGAVKPIYQAPNMEPGIYQHEEMEKRLRRLFFVDFPEQSGDTPPTLGQWLDEMARAQRRIGTPGLPFWREVPAKIFLRFKHLLEVAGVIRPVTVDGTAIALAPMNPSQRAAEQQEIATAMQYLQGVGQTFPEEFRVKIDGGKTMENLAEKMRVKKLISFRDPDQVKEVLGQMAQFVGARQKAGGAGPPEGAGPPAAV